MKKLITNKKGSDSFLVSTKIYYYLIAIFVIVAAMMYFAFFSQNLKYSYSSTNYDLESDLIIARITNVCLAYEDELTGKTYQNIIDVNKFASWELNECFQGETQLAFELSLQSQYTYSTPQRTRLGVPNDDAKIYSYYILLRNMTGGLEQATLKLKI